MQYLPHTLLVTLSVTGYLGLHHLGHANGLFPLLEEHSKNGAYPVDLTPIESLKFLSGVLVGFFYPAVDGTQPGLSLASYVFAGQCIAMWTTLMIEGARHGNKMRLVYFTSAFGMAFQLGGGAVVIPAWFLLHLCTSPTVDKPTKSSLNVDGKTLIATPLAALFGFIVPTVLIALPVPSYLSYQAKINAILIWQLFPIWTNALQAILGFIVPDPQKLSTATLLRYVYAPAIALAAVAHISAMTLAISAYLIPSLYNPLVRDQLVSALFAFPPQPFSDVKITSAGEGSLWFLQYDYAICSWAFLIWSTTLRSAAWKEASTGKWVREIAMLTVKSVLLGPMGAGALLMWERDIAVEDLEGNDARSERKKKA